MLSILQIRKCLRKHSNFLIRFSLSKHLGMNVLLFIMQVYLLLAIDWDVNVHYAAGSWMLVLFLENLSFIIAWILNFIKKSNVLDAKALNLYYHF